MYKTFSAMPIAFWVVVGLLVTGFYWSAKNFGRCIGIPVACVLGTIAVWYVGDALYNYYSDTYAMFFPLAGLALAWEQVATFLAIFLLLAPWFHKRFNKRYLRCPSHVMRIFTEGVQQPQVQRGLTIMFCATVAVWICLVVGAIFRFEGDILYYFFPFLGKNAGPWVTSAIGGGKDSFLALANYLQLMVGAIAGVVAALSTSPFIRIFALFVVVLTWPYYIFDRTRKFILLVTLPGLLSWIFLRFRGRIVQKILLVSALFLLVNAWFAFVVTHRTTTSVTTALMEEGFDFAEESAERHQGLNMYEELCWITMFTSSGEYAPQWGQDYFANLVNPIPRSLWPDKPMISLDYAIARGLGGADTDIGVYSSLSSGLIGQGVLNFGLYVGPAFAAMLTSLWVCWLARLDLERGKIGYLPLYGLGLILTFNMGRDITLLELYPFIFGYAICWLLNRLFGSRASIAELPSLAGPEPSSAAFRS